MSTDFWEGYEPEPVKPALVDWKAEYLKSVESGCITLDELREARAELDAIKQARAAPVQEPVAWTLLLTGEHNGLVGKAGEKFVGAPEYYERVDVYTSPPAQRTWVEVEQVKWEGDKLIAKLKEKNGG